MYYSKFYQALLIVFCLYLSACNNQESSNTETIGSQDDNITNSANKPIDREMKEQLIDSYMDLKNALVETNAETAAGAAEKLANQTAKSDNELLRNIHSNAIRIVDSRDADQQREFFEVLSGHLYTLIKENGTSDQTLYRQYCPMAFNNKGAYWLSTEKEIMNPYFGDYMLKCGSIKETLK